MTENIYFLKSENVLMSVSWDGLKLTHHVKSNEFTIQWFTHAKNGQVYSINGFLHLHVKFRILTYYEHISCRIRMDILRMGRSNQVTKKLTNTLGLLFLWMRKFFLWCSISIEILIDGHNVSRKMGILHKFKYSS